MNFYYITSVLSVFTLFFIGLFVYIKNRKSPINVPFSLLNLAIAAWSTIDVFSMHAHISDQPLVMIVFRILYCIVIFIPAFFAQFIVEFCRSKQYLPVKISYAFSFLLLAAVIFNIDFIRGFVIDHAYGTDRVALVGGLAYTLFILTFVSVEIFGLYSFFTSYKKQEYKVRNQIKYAIVASIMAFIASSIYFLNLLGIAVPPIDNLVIIAYSFMIAYSITKASLIDIRIVIGKFLARLIAFIIIASLFTIVLSYYIISFNPKMDLFYIILLFFCGLAAVYFTEKLRLYIQTPVDRFFIKARYNFPAVTKEIATKFRQALTKEDILKNLHPILTETLDIPQAAYYFFDDQSGDFVGWDPFMQKPLNDQRVRQDDEVVGMIVKTRDIATTPPNYENQTGYHLAVPVFSGKKLLAFILLSKKRSEDEFTIEDLDLFTAIAEHLTVALDYVIRPYEEVTRKFVESQNKLQEAEKELIRSQRLAELGTLTAGVTHEIRNPLASLQSGMYVLKSEPRDKKYLEEYYVKYTRHINRIESIVERVLRMARKEIVETKKSVDLNAAIENIIPLIKLNDNIRVEKKLAPIPKIYCVPEELEEVFINLIENAQYAMPNGGTLSIKTCLVPGGEQNEIKVEIADTGTGIPKENLDKIFDPFFSGRFEGAGLGLSIVYRIIKEHGAAIKVDSTENQGTTFTITFFQPK